MNKLEDCFMMCRFCETRLMSMEEASIPCIKCGSTNMTKEEVIEYRLSEAERRIQELNSALLLLTMEMDKRKGMHYVRNK